MALRSPYGVQLTDQERSILEGRVRKYSSPYRNVIRAKIVLLAADGLANNAIAARLDTPRQIVSKWRKRFCLFRLPGLEEGSRGGRPSRALSGHLVTGQGRRIGGFPGGESEAEDHPEKPD